MHWANSNLNCEKWQFYFNLILYLQRVPTKQRMQVVADGPGGPSDDTVAWAVALPDGTIACSECDYKTDKRTNFYKHRRNHVGE